MQQVTTRDTLQENPLTLKLGEDYFKMTPSRMGVYWVVDRRGRFLYIGVSKNLKKHLYSLRNLTQVKKRPLLFELLKNVTGIFWEECSSEERTLMKQVQMIQDHQPIYNQALQQHNNFHFVGLNLNRDSLVLTTFSKPYCMGQSAIFGPYKNQRLLNNVICSLDRLTYFSIIDKAKLSSPLSLSVLKTKTKSNLSLKTEPLIAQKRLRILTIGLQDYFLGKNNYIGQVLLNESLKKINSVNLNYLKDLLKNDFDVLENFFNSQCSKYLASQERFSLPKDYAQHDWPLPFL